MLAFIIKKFSVKKHGNEKNYVPLLPMKTRTEIENKLKEIKPMLTDKFFVSQIGYFGSYTMDEQTENSDIDIIVEFSEPIGWRFFTLEKYLEEIFGLKIDLVTKDALKENFKNNILQQVRYI